MEAPFVTPLSSKPSPNGSTDSGYASIRGAATPQRQDSEATLDRPRGKLFAAHRVIKLKIFDQEIPTHVEARFTDLMELFNGPLCTHLSRSNFQPSMMSVRLKVLGESEATAKPWVVVQCDEAMYKSVRRFFNQKAIKMEFQHKARDDASLPALEVLVNKRPPRQITLDEPPAVVCSTSFDSTTLCGRLIRVTKSGETRMATIGGVIKIHTSQDDFSLYGITAGHAVWSSNKEADENQDSDFYTDSEVEDDELFPEASHLEYEIEGIIEQPTTEAPASKFLASDCVHEVPSPDASWDNIGQIYKTSSSSRNTTKDFDWALIEMSDKSLYSPNLFVLRDQGCPLIIGEQLKELICRSMKTQMGRVVVLLGGVSGVRWGRLTARSFLRMPSTKLFVETYTVLLNDGIGILWLHLFTFGVC